MSRSRRSTVGRAAGKRPLASLPPTLPAPDAEAPERLSVNDGSWRAIGAQLEAGEDQADANLAELEALYRTADAGLALLDRDLRYVRLNERLAAMNGMPLEAHLGRTVREVVPGLADAAERAFGQVFETGEPISGWKLEGETARQPGIVRRWREDIIPIKRCDGSVRAILVVVREVGPARRETVARLAAIVNSADEAIASKTLDGIVTQLEPGRRRARGDRARGPGPGRDRPHADRAGRHPQQGPPRRQRDSRGVARGARAAAADEQTCRCTGTSAAKTPMSCPCR